jgi:lipoprotein-anchoring transpeptidase ErfK/SrfK
MQNDLKRLVRLLPIVLLLAITLALATTPGAPIASAHTTVSTNRSEMTDVSMPSMPGHLIVVSLSKQWLYAYLNGQQVFNTAIMSGRPALPTPVGTFHVFAKLSPTTFYSPFPPSSPYWYAPTHINYALEFLSGGYFLHDSWWHSVYGPGTNGWHYDPQFGWQSGSHGCVAMPLSSAAWLYNWAPIGTTVQIVP